MKLSIFLFAFLLTCMSMAQDQKASLEEALSQTKQENWTNANLIYQKLLKDKPHDPHILSNYAQVKLALDKPWHAFALWQKALHYHGDFDAAKKGIRYLVAKAYIPDGDYEPNFLAQIKTSFVQSPRAIPLIFIFIFFYLGFSRWIAYLVKKKEANDLNLERPEAPLRAYTYLILLIFFIFLGAYHYQENKKNYGSLIEEGWLYLAPSKDSVALDTISAGKKVEIRREKGDWLQIRIAEGREGWLKKSKILSF